MLVTSTTPLKVYLFDGGVVIFGSVNKKRTVVDLPADDEVMVTVGIKIAAPNVCRECLKHLKYQL